MIKKEDLKRRGWTQEEIHKAEDILDKARHHDVFFSKIVFWSALLVIILGNLIVSLILLPFLIIFQTWVLYTFFTIIALVMGSLYNFLVTDIGHLEKKHHIIASIIIPIVAIVNLIVIVISSNRIINDMPIKNAQHNPFVLSLLFAIAFVLPYLFHKIWMKMRKKN